MSTAVTLVETQLRAYNAQDLDLFMAQYTPDVKLWRIGGEPMASGHEEMRALYDALFKANPLGRASIMNRVSTANTVIDHELVTGRADGYTLEVFAIFEITNGLISQAWFRTDRRYPA